MPTYQYACTEAACGNRFEAVQAFTDAPVSVCPACSGRVRKVFSSVGVVFKGSGFYRNDSRDSQNSHSAAASGDGAKTGDSKSTSTDSSGSTSSDSGSSTSSAGKTSTDTSSSSGSSSAASKAAAS